MDYLQVTSVQRAGEGVVELGEMGRRPLGGSQLDNVTPVGDNLGVAPVIYWGILGVVFLRHLIGMVSLDWGLRVC